MSARVNRADVPIDATWRLEDLYPNVQQWQAEMESILEDIHTVTCYKGKLHESASVLLSCFEALEQLQGRAQRCSAYARLRLSEDSTHAEHQAHNSRAQDMGATLSAALSFVSTEISAFDDEQLAIYMLKEPQLKEYIPFFSHLMSMKPYRLHPETETALAALSGVLASPYQIYQQLKLADMSFEPVIDVQGEKHTVSFALYENRYIQSSDTVLRREAFGSFTDTLSHYQNGIAETYAAEVKKQVVLAKLRGYPDVTSMLLHPQQVDSSLYHTLLNTIQAELAPHMRRWAKLKQRVLGLEEMRFSDLKAPFDPEYDPDVTFEDAAKLVRDALKIMGTEYNAIIQEAFQERWIDHADNIGKSTGAFCSSLYGAHSYILMTWTGSMRNAFTLAHELGHAGHFMLAGANQRITNMRPSLFVIEAPSTMNELLLADHLFRQSTDSRMRRFVITQLLNTYYHNFVTHLLEGEMQRRVYELASKGEPLNAKLLSHLKLDILNNFWGDAVVMDKGAELSWMRQPHYYMSLYPYTYAAGLTASTAAAKRIREQGQPAVDQWLEALKAGGSLPPLDLMKLAGVDLSNPQTIRDAVSYVGELVDELEALFQADSDVL